MSANGKIKTFGKIAAIIVIALGVVVLVGFIAYFTNGFNTSFKTFYVKYGEQTVLERADAALPNNEDVRFDIKYTFDFMNNGKPKGYSVEVLPTVTKDNDFDFTVNGAPYLFSGEKDWTAMFDIKQYDDYFTVNVHDDKTMQDLLSRKHTGKTVAAPEVYISTGYFTLAVSSYNGSATVYIDISVYFAVDGIDIIGGIVL